MGYRNSETQRHVRELTTVAIDYLLFQDRSQRLLPRKKIMRYRNSETLNRIVPNKRNAGIDQLFFPQSSNGTLNKTPPLRNIEAVEHNTTLRQ